MVFVSSCQDITQAKKSQLGARSVTTYGDGNGLVYESNPAVLHNNLSLTRLFWDGVLTPADITDNFYLEEKCQYSDKVLGLEVTSSKNCLEVRDDKSQTASVQKSNNSWAFTEDSDEFYQVNTFYHVNKIQKRFLSSLSSAQNLIHSPFLYNVLPPAIPSNIGETGVFWWDDISNESSFLTVYSKCFIDEINSYFDPANREICLGWNEAYGADFRMAQDPSVIYHEMGHTFVKVMMNLRNSYKDTFTYVTTDFKSELGELSYDEAGSLNEGIADFFSYYITDRKHIGEWAMAKFSADRAMVETDALHGGRIPAKLSYPEFLHYNSVTPETGAEDIHLAGQIVSHYLVSLTQNFKDVCYVNNSYDSSMIHEKASDLTVMLLSETLAEIGDMTATGSDFLSKFYINDADLNELFFTNLNSDESYLWAHQVTPPNFRRFFRIFGKNINQYISNNTTGACPAFSQDNSEVLLDQYGLLLFKSYKDAGQGISLSDSANPVVKKYSDLNANSLLLSYSGKVLSAKTNNTEVNEVNRKNTVLVSKDYLSLASGERATAFVFDNQTFMKEYIASLTFEGKSINLSQGLAAPEYNNGNVKISPGEVVGISLNLVNNANSTMAGVQILANDWDHMKMNDTSKDYINTTGNLVSQSSNIAHWEPCQIDGWPLQTEGGVLASDPNAQGDCDYITRSNKSIIPNNTATVTNPAFEPKYEKDSPQPICMVQYSGTNESKWVSQDFYRTQQLDLADKDCLNNSPTGTGVGVDYNPNECLIRMLPGANQAMLGKIDPQKTWSETLQVSKGAEPVKFLASTMVVMEVNKWIQPGTTFNCRFRTRFTNCQDCYNNNNSGDDYNDYEYAGHEPFKVINFSFTVID
jgi:hypothetical protein